MVDVKDEDEELAQRRQAAHDRLDKKREERARELQRREVVLLETRAKYEDELGPEGEAFALIDAGAEGPIVVKPGLMVVYKEYRAKALKDEVTLEAAQKFILPCLVEPAKDKLLDILQRRAALHDDIVLALLNLHGRNEAIDRGKR